LRERLEDMEELLHYFVVKTCQELHRPVPDIDPSVHERLKTYEWNGNIREFENIVKQVMIIAEGKKTIGYKDFYEGFNVIQLPPLDTNHYYEKAIDAIVQKKNMKDIESTNGGTMQ
jgi:transcriptional regulator with PAS, ATPase and Fis domain